MSMKISIITVTYNAEKFLQRTLDSVSRQTYTDIEHLIIDGASKDETLAMAEVYRTSVPYQVVILSEPDHGLYDAMNKGLRLATGDYLVFLNAGDTLHAEDTLSIVANTQHLTLSPPIQGESEGASPAVIYGDTAIVNEEGQFLHLRHLRPPKELTWKSFRQGMLVCHQAFYVRTDIAREEQYDLQYRHSADVDWCIRVMKRAEAMRLPFANSHAILADFLEGGDSAQHHRASLRERYQVMCHHYGKASTLVMHAWFLVRQLFR